MIEITHDQARVLIRQDLDAACGGRKLPEEQWAVLQDHLQRCPVCRAYRERLCSIDRNMHRKLQPHWSGVPGPRKGLADAVMHARARRAAWRKTLLSGAAGVFALMALILFVRYQRAMAPAPTPTVDTAQIALAEQTQTAAATAVTATPAGMLPAGSFRGLVVFESHRDGNGEIYLLNNGPMGAEQINLTDHPAEDTQPAWSPDGEWIAFLSDREGKQEVYVMTVAETRLTRLTDEPGVAWDGPLSWSSDGKWITLMGERGGDPNQRWVYLVPTTPAAGEAYAAGPRSIPFTRGVTGHPRFAPGRPTLAYVGGLQREMLVMVNTETGTQTIASTENDALTGMFDWSAGGQVLAFVSEGYGSQVQVVTNQQQTVSRPIVLDDSDQRAAYRGVAWRPGSLIAATLKDEDAQGKRDGCWTARLFSAVETELSREVEDLCVEGGLEGANWSPDGKWLLLNARQRAETRPAYYAVRVVKYLDAPEDFAMERLVELGDGLALDPAVRPTGRSLGLRFFAARAAQADEVVSRPVQASGGEIYFSALRADRAQVGMITPDGSRSKVLAGGAFENTCPALSPDGETIAFLSDRASELRGVTEVFLMDREGGNLRQLTRLVTIAEDLSPSGLAQSRYDCPVWSPDGRRIAVVLRAVDVRLQVNPYLVVITVDREDEPDRIVEIPVPTIRTLPRWQPDGHQLWVVIPSSSRRGVQVMYVNPESGAVGELFSREGWNDIHNLEFSPDGRKAAMIMISSDAQGRQAADLMIYDRALENISLSMRLPNFETRTDGVRDLAWLPDGNIGLVHHLGLTGRYRSQFQVYDSASGKLVSLLPQFEDVVFNAAWSAKGDWVVYTAESGVWALDVNSARETATAPVLLTNTSAYEIDWR